MAGFAWWKFSVGKSLKLTLNNEIFQLETENSVENFINKISKSLALSVPGKHEDIRSSLIVLKYPKYLLTNISVFSENFTSNHSSQSRSGRTVKRANKSLINIIVNYKYSLSSTRQSLNQSQPTKTEAQESRKRKTTSKAQLRRRRVAAVGRVQSLSGDE